MAASSHFHQIMSRLFLEWHMTVCWWFRHCAKIDGPFVQNWNKKEILIYYRVSIFYHKVNRYKKSVSILNRFSFSKDMPLFLKYRTYLDNSWISLKFLQVQSIETQNLFVISIFTTNIIKCQKHFYSKHVLHDIISNDKIVMQNNKMRDRPDSMQNIQ